MSVHIALFGPIRVTVDGETVQLSGKTETLLAHLLPTRVDAVPVRQGSEG